MVGGVLAAKIELDTFIQMCIRQHPEMIAATHDQINSVRNQGLVLVFIMLMQVCHNLLCCFFEI